MDQNQTEIEDLDGEVDMAKRKNRIYLISQTGGAAYANNEKGAGMLEAKGYQRCSRKGYQQRVRRIVREYGEPAARQLLREMMPTDE